MCDTKSPFLRAIKHLDIWEKVLNLAASCWNLLMLIINIALYSLIVHSALLENINSTLTKLNTH